MDPTETLMQEHRLIERMLKVLMVAAEQAKVVEVDIETFEIAIDFIRNYSDKFHHAKEEGELFPLIEKKGIQKDNGPIGAMLKEHDIGRNYVKGMEDSLSKYKAGDKSQGSEIARNAFDFIDLLAEHIMKEDNHLYPMGNRVISDQERISLALKFKEIEAKDEDLPKKYLNIVTDLEKKFNIPSL